MEKHNCFNLSRGAICFDFERSKPAEARPLGVKLVQGAREIATELPFSICHSGGLVIIHSHYFTFEI
jgi:hypothetical protein